MTKLVSLSTGALISGLVGVFMARYNRTRAAKDRFLIFMSILRSTIPTEKFYWFYTEERPRIKEEVFRLRPFLGGNAPKMDVLWADFYTFNAYEALDDKKESTWGFDIEPGAHPPKKPSDVLKEYFDRFSRLAK